MMIYRVYCLRHFKETHFHWVWDKAILKPMLSFSGWDLYGNACVTARQQGINFLINMFFGVTLNAASSIATTVNGVVQGLTTTVTQAFKPQAIKQYAAGNVKGMEQIMENAAKYYILLIGAVAIPLFFEMHYAMGIWLGQVPRYADSFCKLLIIASLIASLNNIINIGIHATGNIKYISIITGTVYLLNLPFLYVCYKPRANPNSLTYHIDNYQHHYCCKRYGDFKTFSTTIQLFALY